MICPRCGREISDSETLCPFCFQDINKNIEFNDFRKDGFIQVRIKDESDTSSAINYAPKYFDLTELSMLVVAVVFILFVATITLFSFKFVQKNERRNDQVLAMASRDEAATEESTEAPTPNYVESISVKDLYGIWRVEGAGTETETSPFPYYSFSSDGTVVEYHGTVKTKGTFNKVSSNDKPTVYIDIESTLQGTFEFSMIDNDDGTRLLIFSEKRSGASSTYYLTKVEHAKIVKMRPEESSSVTRDKNLIGHWVNKELKQAYIFYEDGRVVRRNNTVYRKGIWKNEDASTVNIQYIKGSYKSISLEYHQKGNKLKIDNDIYVKAP